MPIDKKPFKRYERINEIMNLRGSRMGVVKFKSLAEELGIGERMLSNDLKFMKEELGAPLEYDYSQKGWRYTEDFDYVSGIPLLRKDVLLLRLAVETLAQGGQLKNFKQLPDILNKVHKASKKWISDKAPEKAIYFDPLPEYDGARHLDFMLNAIENYRRIRFDYQGFHGAPVKSVLFDPYFLRHYDRRWYVGGFSHDPSEGFVRVFPLERIQGDPVLEGFFHDKPQDYNAATYWKDIYGITVPPNRQVEDVVLEFNAIQGRYFLTTPFYEPFEIVEQSPEKLVVRMRLVPNIDLTNKLASFGARVKVLAPARLAQEMAGIHRAAAGLYD